MAFDLVGKAVKNLRLPTVNYNGSHITIIPAQQGDRNSRYFSVTLYDDRGDISLGGYSKVTLRATLPNGDPEFTEGEFSDDNKCICTIAGSMLNEVGKVACNVVLTGNDSEGNDVTLSSQTFYVLVSNTQLVGSEGSNGELSGLDQILRAINELESKFPIETANIKDQAVTRDKIEPGAVSTYQISSHGVQNHNIKPGAVTLEKLADDALSIVKGANRAEAFDNVDQMNAWINAKKEEVESDSVTGKTFSAGSTLIYSVDDKPEGHLIAVTPGAILDVNNDTSLTSAFVQQGRAYVLLHLYETTVIESFEAEISYSNGTDSIYCTENPRLTYVEGSVDNSGGINYDLIKSHNIAVGTNLYIRDIGVPDYWWDGSKAQQLETQKVNLAEYADKDFVAQNYVAKITNNTFGVYVHDEESGVWVDKVMEYASYANAPPYTFVQRDGSSCIQVLDPINDYHAANKRFVRTYVFDSANIKDGAVINAKIAQEAVTHDKIAVGAVGNTRIAPDAVTTSKIKNGAVTVEKLNSSAFSSKDGTPATLVQRNADGLIDVGEPQTESNPVPLGDLLSRLGSIVADIRALEARVAELEAN